MRFPWLEITKTRTYLLLMLVAIIAPVACLSAIGLSTRPSDSSSAASTHQNAENKARAVKKISEDQARALLLSELRAHKVADLDCLGFPNESSTSGNSKAELWEFAARERHDERCGGDPAVSHVRDRYKINSAGEVWIYDVANDEYNRL